MPAYGDDAARGCEDAQVESGDQFCGAELERVRAILGSADAVTIGCTQQAPLFSEVAEELGFVGELAFANIRETAGWSVQSGAAGPKVAALLAMATEPAAVPAAVTLSSNGVILIYGRDETAIEAGRQLAGKLDVTVLLSRPGEIVPPRIWEFPVTRGTVRNAAGHLGSFELTIDDFATPV
ncbi:MAG TPA: 4Fe-4S ferredoxin, partial [Alphaproteobacteria bacterium]|nr:4Fe-4S ferredoxin [Alphaproteobacteria bacterium]